MKYLTAIIFVLLFSSGCNGEPYKIENVHGDIYVSCDGDCNLGDIKFKTVHGNLYVNEMFLRLKHMADSGAICRQYGHTWIGVKDYCKFCGLKRTNQIQPRAPIIINDGDVVITNNNLYSVCNQLEGKE